MHWVKFNVVGLAGFALQSAALFLLTHGAYRMAYLPATAFAVELAIVHNFFWHQCWTWRDRPTATLRATIARLIKFNGTNGTVSLAGNLALMGLFVGRLGWPVNGANVVTVITCSLVNFLLADRIAFEAAEA